MRDLPSCRSRPIAMRPAQAGQSMVEFLVALAVLLPLFLAVTYAGRYGDIQQATVQASRYAAFQRVMQPNAAQLADSKIEDQMRARFFVRGDYLHSNGRVQSDDSAVGLADKGLSSTWRDLSFNPLLTAPDSAKLSYQSAALNAGAVAKLMGVMTKSAGKSYGGATVAQVEVGLVNKMDLSVPSPAALSIAAATAAVGDNLSSSGSKATRDAAATIVPTAKIPGALTGFFEKAMLLFEPAGPIIGCIKPDVVPTGRLEGYAPAGDCQ